MLISVSGDWARASYGQVPPNATQFNDEFGAFYVVRAEVEVELATEPYIGRVTIPGRLEGSQAIVTYNGQVKSTPYYEVSFCTYTGCPPDDLTLWLALTASTLALGRRDWYHLMRQFCGLVSSHGSVD